MKAGELIKQYRIKLSMSQVVLADKSGVPQSTISAIEHGTTPTWDNMKKLAITLNISVGDLLGTETQEVKN
ncbi:helix-turn-helix domain-containing protein [Schleiferilactobacillus perolens]|jgi:transcriptional regulator with XRE-family HTH domain|uniref:helix-turn-helix domain-containing protein n=1 Tax=Schleiferilactobacillus perolens TaxID=100468 RepID=UPI00235353E8|nr:helix-turn-helix transcriptional regulator [Schleiferilactobacillus perolens]MCI2170651.1 helix-turn-helix domain-containing protein [Schleiferilactobacillus perolens]